MTDKEHDSLRALYEGWPTERLARAAGIDRGQYTPGAVAVMLGVLHARGVSTTDLASIPPIAPPVRVIPRRDTRFFPAELNRKRYALRWLAWVVCLLGIGVLVELAPVLQPSAMAGCLAVGLVYKVVGLDIPRLRNAGFSPWILLLLAVPVANLVLLVLLFAAPAKE